MAAAAAAAATDALAAVFGRRVAILDEGGARVRVVLAAAPLQHAVERGTAPVAR